MNEVCLMSKDIAVRLDGKGRLQLPQKIRAALRAEPGDVLFLQLDDGDTVLIVRAINPFDVLAEQALQEHGRGETIPLEKFAKENGSARHSK